MKQQLGWKVVSYGGGALSAVLTQRLLSTVWRRVRNEPPPDNMADRSASWGAALAWAIATGVGIGVVRLLTLRSASRAWEAATHERPPGIE